MKKSILLCGLAVMLFNINRVSGQADSAFTFSLPDAQNYAIDNYFVSKNAKLDIESAKKKVLETTAIGLPQVSAKADYQRFLDDLPPGFPMQIPGSDQVFVVEFFQKENITYGATVSQLVFSGEYIVGLQASKTYKTFSEQNYDKVKVDLKQNVAGSYYAILVLEANKAVLEKSLNNLSNNLTELQQMYSSGLIEDTEVDQLALTLKQTESDLATMENQIVTLRNLFKYQLGLPAGANVTLSDSIDNLIESNMMLSDQYNFNLEENIDYKLLLTNEKLQDLSLLREKSTLLPTLSAFYNYSGTTNETAITPPKNMVGVSLNWNIFQSGMRYAKISQAKIELEKARNIKEQEGERLTIAAQQALYDYKTAFRKYQNEKTNFELSEKIFDKTRFKYEQGVSSSLELSIVNTQYLGAQISYSTAIQQLLNAKVALDKAYNKL